MQSSLAPVSSDIIKACLPGGQAKPFPQNSFSLMVLTGAKGSMVNHSQVRSIIHDFVFTPSRYRYGIGIYAMAFTRMRSRRCLIHPTSPDAFCVLVLFVRFVELLLPSVGRFLALSVSKLLKADEFR